MEIGEKLREAREAEGITLDSLQETTKIQKRYLMAIEQGNFHILPGKFYARAFIKEYALAVGLNPAELLNEFGEEVPKTESKDTEQYSRMQRSKRQDSASKSPAVFSVIPAIIVVLLIIGIIFVAVSLTKRSMSDTDDNPDNQQGQNEVIITPDNKNPDSNNLDVENNENNNEISTEIDENVNENNEDNQASSAESTLTLIETGSGAKPESTFELSYTGDSVILKFEPTGKSWWDVVDENKTIIDQGFTAANEPIELDVSGKTSIRLNLGAANFIPVIIINDTQLVYPVDPNQFVNQRIWIELNKETE